MKENEGQPQGVERIRELLKEDVAQKLAKSMEAYNEYVEAKRKLREINRKQSKQLARLYAAKYREEHPEKHIFYGKRRTQEMQPGYLRTKLKQIGVSYKEAEDYPELLDIMREHLIAYRNRDESWDRTKQRRILLSKINDVRSKQR